MDQWSGIEPYRAALGFAALLYFGIWVQVSLYHRAGAFKKVAMWGPVLLTPLIIGAAVAAVVRRDGIWGYLAVGLLALGALEGLVGLYYHLKGTAYQVGGITIRNLMAGPPPVLPVAYALFGVLGFMAVLRVP